MLYCVIEYKAPTIDQIQMPLYFYSRPLEVIEETDNFVCVLYEKEAYWFKKEYVANYSH